MVLARRVLVGLAWLYVLGIAVQFFLAGIGLPELGGRGMGGHEAFGYSALHLTPILLIVLALVARASRVLIGLTVALAVISFVQPIWVSEFRGEFLASMHIVGALVIFVLAHTVARQATHLMRQGSASA